MVGLMSAVDVDYVKEGDFWRRILSFRTGNGKSQSSSIRSKKFS